LAKSKYTLERVSAICDAIARTGSDKAGWEAGQINKDTFYSWLKIHADFSELVSRAKAEYRETCPETLVRQANKAFADYLYGRMEKVIRTHETGISLKTGEPYEREIVQRVPVGIPKWAIERVLGPAVDEIDAIKVLVKAGWLPPELLELTREQFSELRSRLKSGFAGLLPDTQRERTAGISEATADAIRREILGLELERKPENPAALPEALDRRQEQD
jgi:hypothetical protein